MSQPPLLPAVALLRVLRLARVDGASALALGGLFALMMAAAREIPFAALGLLAAGAGAIELHGAGLLRQGSPRGMRWLIASQPLLLLALWSYCALRLTIVPLPPVPEGMQPFFVMSAAQWGVEVETYVLNLNRVTVLVLAAVGLVVQGSLILCFLRHRRAVEQALVQN